MATVLAAVGSGDEVVVIEPCYDSYLPAIRLAGGTAVPVPRAHGRRSLLPHRLAARARRHHAQDAPADAELPAQPHRRRARRQRPGRAGSHRARHRRTAAVGRGLRTYRVRRQASCQRRAPSAAGRACLRHLVLRQNLSHHRLEDRLLLRAAPAQRRTAQGAPVHGVHRAFAHAVRVGRIHARSQALPGPAGLLPDQARPPVARSRKTRFRPCPAPARSSCWPTTAISPSRPKPTSRAT